MNQEKPPTLYHGSSQKVEGLLHPILVQDSPDHTHTRPSVFATERADIAALFMLPTDVLLSIGFEIDIAYICIWGTRETIEAGKMHGYLYSLSSESFEKIGKEYEWQAFEAVEPLKVEEFDSAINGLLVCGAQVYFITDDALFDRIVSEKTNRAPLLEGLVSENKRQNINVKSFYKKEA